MKKRGFTLVELILVITILVILWTIAIISFKWYSASARDSVKITNLQNLSLALSLYNQQKDSLPIPKNTKNIDLGNGVELYEWGFSDEIVSKIGYLWDYMDSTLNESYVFGISWDKKKFSILAYLEWEWNILTNKVNAFWRDNLYSVWDDIWLILNSDNSPLKSDFNYSSASWNYNILNDGKIYSWDKDFVKFVYAQLKKDVSLEKDLILYYDFESITADGKLKDLSGKGMHGSKFQWSSKYKFWNDSWINGKSTYFDAKNLVYSPNAGIDYQVDDSLTVSYWIKFTKNIYWHPMGLLRGDTGWWYTYRYNWVDSLLIKAWNKQSVIWKFEINKWYNLTFVSWTSNINTYINGKKVLSMPFPRINTTSPITFWEVFRWNKVFASLFEWNIDEAKIYNRSLSEKEVIFIYEKNKGN